METFTKLASSIVHSTVWSLDNETRIVWITLLALCDREGYVGASVPGIAKVAGVSVEAVDRAMEIFQEPDPRSRNKDNDGRRIAEAPRGWIVLNYKVFRGERDAEARRVYDRELKRRARAASVHTTDCPPSLPKSAAVCRGMPRSAAVCRGQPIAEAEAEAEAYAEHASAPAAAREKNKAAAVTPATTTVRNQLTRAREDGRAATPDTAQSATEQQPARLLKGNDEHGARNEGPEWSQPAATGPGAAEAAAARLWPRLDEIRREVEGKSGARIGLLIGRDLAELGRVLVDTPAELVERVVRWRAERACSGLLERRYWSTTIRGWEMARAEYEAAHAPAGTLATASWEELQAQAAAEERRRYEARTPEERAADDAARAAGEAVLRRARHSQG